MFGYATCAKRASGKGKGGKRRRSRSTAAVLPELRGRGQAGRRVLRVVGVRLDPESEDPDAQANELGGAGRNESTVEQGASSPVEDGGTETGSKTNASRLDYGKAFEKIKDLPVVFQVVLGLGLTILLGLLSPVSAIACAVLFWVSLVGVIARVAQHRSVRGWGSIAVVSLIFALMYGGVLDNLAGSTDPRSNKSTTQQAAKDKSNTLKLRDEAYKPYIGVLDQHLIDDLWVTDGTATVELQELTGPGSKSPSWQADRERGEGNAICNSTAAVASKNGIPIDEVKVVSVRGKEVANCVVKSKVTADKTK
jgi:hypothetical protein